MRIANIRTSLKSSLDVAVVFLLGGAIAACEDPVTPPVSEGAVVTINEFLASNDTGLQDEDGEFEDWIELHNSGNGAADLTGWHLTDDGADLTQWTLPSLTLQPGAFLVIFASGKDRTDAAGELHTNFKLSAGGERLALVHPDGTTIQDDFFPEYPAQTTDISYGALPSGGEGFLRQPTPGATNSIAALASVTLTPASSLFTDSVVVTLSEASGATIHYTTDGSAPDATSPVYSGSLALTQSARVRAVAIDAGFTGPEGYAFYTAVDSSITAYESDLPIVIVHTFGATVPNDDIGIESSMLMFAAPTGKTSINSPLEYVGGTSMEIRGSTSAEFPKKQYKIELHDASGSDVDADLLGLGLEEDWILYAPGYYDRNMIANPLMQRLAGQVGLHELGMRFVELFLAEGQGPVTASDYAGLYMLSENIKVGRNRLDLADLDPGDDEEPEVTGGYVIKLDRPDPDEYAFTMPNGFPYTDAAIIVARPKLDDLGTAQQAWIKQHFEAFHAAIRGPNSADSLLGYAPYIDLPSWIDAHILVLISKDPDFLLFSHYMYKEREGKIKTGPLWDFDRALNAEDDRTRVPDELSVAAQPFQYEWWGQLFSDPVFKARYQARWTELRASTLSDASVAAEIDALASQIASTYPREDVRWGPVSGYGSRYGDFAGEITALKNWLSTRMAFLDGAIAGL